MAELLEKVVLVTPENREIGLMDKMEAHRLGLLHRAFSVFLFNFRGEMLLQKRAATKYHSPGQWTNAVCSHPRQGETFAEAAARRLKEELGITTDLSEKFHFVYKAKVGQDLWEHELDYVFTGIFEEEFHLNPQEVSEVRYLSLAKLEREMEENPSEFTEWFKIILNEYRHHL